MARLIHRYFLIFIVLVAVILPQILSWGSIMVYFTAKGNDNHQDGSREGVGSTAFAVSAARYMESIRKDRKPIINDEIANAIFNNYQYESLVGWKWRLMTVSYLFKDSWPFKHLNIMNKLSYIQDLVAIRTKYIDNELYEMIIKETADDNSHEKDGDGIKQFVIIGAGLDARVLRLPVLNHVITYELDFPIMLETKWKLFEYYNFKKPYKDQYKAIKCDFSLGCNHWKDKLIKNGFKSHMKTVWLLEGLTGYLESKELIELIDMISQLSSKGSYMLATFIGEESVQDVSKESVEMSLTNLHRFRTNEPCLYLSNYSKFTCISSYGIGEIGNKLNVSPSTISIADSSYRIVKAIKE